MDKGDTEHITVNMKKKRNLPLLLTSMEKIKNMKIKIYENRRLSILGGCPRIGIFSQIEAFLKNKHSHVIDIGVYAYLRALFFINNEELGGEGILGQPPRGQHLLNMVDATQKYFINLGVLG